MATLAARALGESGLLEELAGGRSRGTVAVLEQGFGDPLGTVRTRAHRKGAGWALHGTKPVVVDGHTADWVIVAALGRGRCAVVPWSASRWPNKLVPSLDPTRKLARLVLDGTPAGPLGPTGGQAGLWRRVLDDIAVALAAESVGASDRALEMATEYAKVRVVFDQPIATFQVVKHRIVDMFHTLELARVGVHYAGVVVGRGRAGPGPGRRYGVGIRGRGRGEGDRRRHPAPRRRGIHLGERRPLPVRAGEARRDAHGWEWPPVGAPGGPLHRTLTPTGAVGTGSNGRTVGRWPSTATEPRPQSVCVPSRIEAISSARALNTSAPPRPP